MRPDFRKYRNDYWLIGNEHTENKRTFRDLIVKVPKGAFQGLLKHYITDQADNKDNWASILDILKSNDEFLEYYNKRSSYINAVYIKNAEVIENSKIKYNIKGTKLKDTSHNSINYKYIETHVD